MYRNYLIGLLIAATALILTSCGLTYRTHMTTDVPCKPTPLVMRGPSFVSVTTTPTIVPPGHAVNTATETALPTATVTPRWKTYQTALVNAFLPQGYSGVCEWTILGKSSEEVYVWALCRSGSTGPAMSAPAVIVLDPNGDIQRVEVPSDGAAYSRDVRRLFPPDIQEKIFAFYRTTSLHAALGSKEYFDKRFSNPDLPPRIVTLGTPLP